ncbi:hypothetical protein QQ045_001786 [Rhodiola kirilowii]
MRGFDLAGCDHWPGHRLVLETALDGASVFLDSRGPLRQGLEPGGCGLRSRRSPRFLFVGSFGLILEGRGCKRRFVSRRDWLVRARRWREMSIRLSPVAYKSKTVFEDATPEIVRDFFWDDEFRPKWDPMLSYVNVLEECSRTGAMVVHWIKKFPFFCSDREYIIGRRIWESGKSYYCVTKGVPYPNLPKRDKPRQVDLYFSSWVIRPVESCKGDGQLTACEVTLVHYEDMGIPKDVAKLRVRHYSLELSSGAESRGQVLNTQTNREHGIDWKWVAVGGTVAVACALYTCAIGKVLFFGAAQRITRR